MLTSLLMVAFAAAAPSISEGGNGTYTLSDSTAALATRTDAALESTLDPMNFAVRMIAEGRLQDAITTCSTYTFTTDDVQMRIQCDDKPPIKGALNGAPTSYTNEKDVTYSITVQKSTDQVVFNYAGESATQVTTYRFTDGGLVVSKEIRSASLEVPMRWDTNYTRGTP
ncbi:MAG: hypothetical protein P8R54_31155 [Myxococcota bacterium]|nr:hypothetical protein [Myxococcota bacterium]